MPKLHKIVYIVPSECRRDLEKMIEELLDGREGFRHVGSYDFDPNKPQFFQRPAQRPNGSAKRPKPPKVDMEEKVLSVLTREPRMFTTYELMHRLGVSKNTITNNCRALIASGKVRSLQRGIYIAVQTTP